MAFGRFVGSLVGSSTAGIHGREEEALMTVKHLDHLNLTVHDLEESADWYARMFGFDLVERGVDAEGRPWGVLRSGEAMLCIYERPGFTLTTPSVDAAEARHRLNHFALRIEDDEAWRRTLATEKPELFYESPVRWPHSTAWYVADPTGYTIEVVAWESDRVAFG
jgi:catechol 2,3-dioxygenase-like lactoylglutathione lyase family enzyme